MHPDVDYTRSGRYSIAYQVVGEGPPDVVFIPEWFNNLETQWEDPRLARFPARLASFARVIMLNQRGMGLSDPISIDGLFHDRGGHALKGIDGRWQLFAVDTNELAG